MEIASLLHKFIFFSFIGMQMVWLLILKSQSFMQSFCISWRLLLILSDWCNVILINQGLLRIVASIVNC